MAYTPTPYYPGYQPMYYQPPMMDNLAQLRAGQYQQPVPPQTPQPMPQQSGQGGHRSDLFRGSDELRHQ